MKKLFTLLLAFAMVLSLGVAAFADDASNEPAASKTETDVKSPSGGGGGTVSDLGWGQFTTPKGPSEGMEIYNAAGEKIAVVPGDEVTLVAVGEADMLSPEDREAFLQAYEEIKTIQDAVVQYFYWVDIPDEYKTDDFAWAKFNFSCAGSNVRVLVNGKVMDVVHVRGVEYYAKLTELGALTILVGLPQQEKGERVLELYNADDELYDSVPWPEVIEVPVENADALDADVKEAFLAAYDEVRDDENLNQFLWLDVPDSYKTDEFAWAKYEFTCEGENATDTVNGKPVEVVNEDGDNYYARLTEFGAVAIFCD